MNPPVNNPVQKVILVHGLWFKAAFMRLLGRRLDDQGFSVSIFSYRTTRQPIGRSAGELHEFCRRRAPTGAHFVAHSLGGLLTLEMLGRTGWSQPGRVLFLGTPLNGSEASRRVRSWPGGGRLLGHAAPILDRGAAVWPRERETGMIAGDTPWGLGRLTGGMERPHDGTVSVSETRHPGLTDRIELPVTHTSMLFSKEVARQAAAFLDQGRFRRACGKVSEP